MVLQWVGQTISKQSEEGRQVPQLISTIERRAVPLVQFSINSKALWQIRIRNEELAATRSITSRGIPLFTVVATSGDNSPL